MADKMDAGKKRKRNTDGSSKPSKRVAFEDAKKVKISLQDGGEWAPIIASTPGLELPTSLPLKPYTKPRTNVSQRPGKTSISTNELLLHSQEHPKLDYTAHEEEDERKNSLIKHYIGVLDPETGKLEVMEARKMVVRGSVRAHQAGIDDLTSGNVREQRNNLGKEFGTRKSKKAIQSVIENAISPDKSMRNLGKDGRTKVDAASAAILESMAEATANMSTREALQVSSDAAKPRPKANLDTDDITKVYTINELIGEGTMALIPVRQWQEALKSGKGVQSTSRFVGHRIVKHSTSVEKLKLLRFVQLLIEFYKLTKRKKYLPDRDDLKPLLGDIPESVLQGIKKKFTTGNQWSKFSSDLLTTHICALALVIENYEFDCWDLKEDLQMEMAELVQYFREIGATAIKISESMRNFLKLDKASAFQRKLIKLKIPLDFPKQSVGRKK